MAKLKILLVDDEPSFREPMGLRLKSWGYDLIEASNGKEAIDAVVTKNPDIVILDYVMPDKNGAEVLKEIREIDNKIPVIMFTAHPDMEKIEGTTKLGVSAFIPKLNAYTGTQREMETILEAIKKKLQKKK